MTDYPGAIDDTTSLPNATALDPVTSPDLATVQTNQNDAIKALEAKLGIGSSTPVAGSVLLGTGPGATSYGALPLTTHVTGTLPVANGGTGAATLPSGQYLLGNGTGAITGKTTAQLAAAVGALLFPVGCIYISTTSTNPNTSLGFGTWVAYGAGRTLVGVGTSDQAFAAGDTGGESTHTLTSTEMPSHTHTVDPPNTGTSSNGDHSHTYWLSPNWSFTKGTSTVNTVQDIESVANVAHGTSTNGAHSHTVDIAQFNSGSAGSGGAHNNLQPYIVVYFWQRTA